MREFSEFCSACVSQKSDKVIFSLNFGKFKIRRKIPNFVIPNSGNDNLRLENRNCKIPRILPIYRTYKYFEYISQNQTSL